MRKSLFNWQVILGLVLLVSSALLYYFHYLIFRDAHHIFLYLIGDIAFVFIEVLLVTLVLHNLLVYREKKSLLKKLNMVIGAFFSEVGTSLIQNISLLDSDASRITDQLIITEDWQDVDFNRIRKAILAHKPAIDHKNLDLVSLKEFLSCKRDFLLALLENPNLLEHEAFTDLLWSIFHLTEELSNRKNPRALSEADSKHLAGDIKRVYNLLIVE